MDQAAVLVGLVAEEPRDRQDLLHLHSLPLAAALGTVHILECMTS